MNEKVLDRIEIEDYPLFIGYKLPISLYNKEGKLMYSEGTEITTNIQIDRLHKMDLYQLIDKINPENQEQKKLEEKITKVQVHPFALLAKAELKLATIMKNLLSDPVSSKKDLESLSAGLFKLINTNSDIVLGYCHWPYNDRSGLNQSVICSVLAASASMIIGIEKNKIIALIQGALMQNASSWDFQIELNNQTEQLTDEQKERLQRHPVESAEMLARAGIQNQDIIDIVKYHHERPDATGYPFGLPGGEIPQLAKLVGIADTYIAMTTHRAYRKVFPTKTALREILLVNKDPEVELYGSFIKTLGIYPPGTFVLLKNGETAVVIERNLDNSIKPIVKSIMSPNGTPYPKPERHSLVESGLEIFRCLTFEELVQANWYDLWEIQKTEKN
ncbi:MAG: HD domain-containing protein [Gammaproteobacteria bacterium]|nr:HD domain-containing protein [Gammaproteobacteria bacterium]